MKACWGRGEERATGTAYGFWPNEALPGELAPVLPTTRHFEQATELVTSEFVRPGPRAHIEAITAYAEAGFDELYVRQD